MSLPRLATYAHDEASALRLLEAGVDQLIIDDPRLSIRSWAPARSGDFAYFSPLIQCIREHSPTCRVSLNIDGLYRDQQLPLIQKGISAAVEAGFNAIRLLDAGIGPLVRTISAEITLELATEMGNCSIPSVECYLDEGFEHQVCSNDWPAEDLAALRQQQPSMGIEILVHGPVLLQYSDRRQLSAQSHPDADPDQLTGTNLQTVVIDGRPYPFADHQHGNIMYNTFDRSLYPYGQKLWDLGLDGWLIDGRGQGDDYTLSALRAFADLRQRCAAGQAEVSDPSLLEAMQAVGDRRFKPGFFLANNTDYCFDDVVAEQQVVDIVAETIDVIREDAITLLVRMDFGQQDEDLVIATPEGRSWQADLSQLRDLDGQLLSQASTGMVVRLPWAKGAVPGSNLQRPSSSTM